MSLLGGDGLRVAFRRFQAFFEGADDPVDLVLVAFGRAERLDS